MSTKGVDIRSLRAFQHVVPRLLVICFCILHLLAPFGFDSKLENAFADEESTAVRFQGLNVPCSLCRRVDEVYCELPYQGEKLLVRCSEALDYLLPELVRVGPQGRGVDSGELIQFLLKEAVSYPASRAAFELLFRSEDAVMLVKESAGQLFSRHRKLLEELANQRIGASEIWKEFYYSLGVANKTDYARLQTIIALRYSEFEVEALFSELTIIDTKHDARLLQIQEETLRSLEDPSADEFAKVRQLLPACSAADKLGVFRGCSSDSLKTLSKQAQGYLNQLQVRSALSFIQENNASPEMTFAVLSQTAYREFRTPETHELILRALKNIAVDSEIELAYRLQVESELEMLKLFAEYDQEVETVLQTIVARVEMQSGHVEASRLRQALGLKLRDSVSTEQGGTGATRTWLLILLALAFLVFFLKRMITSMDTDKPEQEEQIHVLSSEERSELRKLRAYFHLTPSASTEELIKRYRERARELHPDMEQGNADDFNKLSENYERARVLMGR